MFKLECLDGPSKGQVFEFSKDSAVLGRSRECDVYLDDCTCSRAHARIERRDDAYYLCDLGSRNGVLLNGTQIEEGPLSPGDRFSLGTNAFVFRCLPTADLSESSVDIDDLIENSVTLKDVETRLIDASRLGSQGKISEEELEDLRRAYRQLQAVYSLNRVINSTLKLEDIYDLIAEDIFENFEAVERICIFRHVEDTRSFRRVASHSRTDAAEEPVSRDVLQHVRTTPAGILANDVESDSRFNASHTLLECSVRSFMCVPLNVHERVVGAVYVENRSRPDCFQESDLELLTVFGNQMARAVENASLYEELETSFYEAVRSLSKALEAKDKYTRGHSDRVARYAVGIGTHLGLSGAQLNRLKIAAELHDIGKIAIPEEILNLPARLSDEQFELIKKHPEHGVEILRPIHSLESVLPIVLHHHERYNGEGYPKGWKGEQIPLEARILNLADAFDAMTTARSYNQPISLNEALARCRAEAGVSFDAACVDALCRNVEEEFGAIETGGRSAQTSARDKGESGRIPEHAETGGEVDESPDAKGQGDERFVTEEVT